MALRGPVNQSFSITKWYMDVVSDDGEAIVAYAADVRFRALNLSYTSVLHHRHGRTRETSSLRPATVALEDAGSPGQRLTWVSRALSARGTWSAEGEGTKETLLSNDAGTVEWNCVMPLARAEVDVEGRVVRGLGYAEELTMTIPPWDLPLDELRWGRFTADGASVVWLDWRGAHSRKIVMKHGVRVIGVIEDRAIEMPDDEARVLLGEGSVIREGALGAGPLNVVAELHALLPSRLLLVRERKICAPATLEQPFAQPVRGWAIADVVKWA